MEYRRRIFFTDKQKSEIWDRWQREKSMNSIVKLKPAGFPGCHAFWRDHHINT